MERYSVGILGATGLVGQRLVERLAGHPWFETTALAASARSVGRKYADVARWGLGGDPPSGVAGKEVRRCRTDELDDCDLVLSALDADVAREVEPRFVADGFAVISNSSAHRREPDVPLLVPEINADHLKLLAYQRERTGGGYIVTNPNCSTTGLAVALAPLHRAFGVRRMVVATLQAASGAGVKGPRALELMGNVLPHIPGEEEKIEYELSKILGNVHDGEVRPSGPLVSAHCHRVPVVDGHLEAVSLETATPATPAEVAKALREFVGDLDDAGLPSAPARPIVVRDDPDRPQPRLDRDAGDGMTVVVGRIRTCPVLGLKLILLAHNAVRGAAGGTVLNAELLAARRLLPRRKGA